MVYSFADRLTEAIRARNSVLCGGIDPHSKFLPKIFAGADPGRATRDWVYEVLRLLTGRVAVIKPQVALFERLGVEGMQILADLARDAKNEGLLVIMDAKRGDISHTAQAYAEAWLGDQAPFPSDAVTVNPYLGLDTLAPFINQAKAVNCGIFCLLRTSNDGADDLQGQNLVGGQPLFHHLAKLLQPIIEDTVEQCGFSAIGAVVGATKAEDLKKLRRALPQALFLIPGFGAQGAGADAALAGLIKGSEGWEGGVISSSRGLLMPPDSKDATTLADWRTMVTASVDRSLEALR